MNAKSCDELGTALRMIVMFPLVGPVVPLPERARVTLASSASFDGMFSVAVLAPAEDGSKVTSTCNPHPGPASGPSSRPHRR